MSEITLEKAEKGQKINLDKKVEGGVKTLSVGCGWDPVDNGEDFDADLSAAFLTANGKVESKENFLYWGSKSNSAGKLAAGDYAHHTGDNLTGEGEGDDETIEVDLTKVPDNITKIEFHVAIYKAESRNQTFGMVSNAYVRTLDKASGEALTRFDLDFDASTATAIKFCTLHKRNGEWIFGADNVPVEGGLKAISSSIGL